MQGESDEIVVTEPSPGVVIVRLNRPKARNALNQKVRQRLAECFVSISENASIRCVIITGGASVFAAGADIREIAESSPIDMYSKHVERLWAAISDCPKPVIAAVNGFALGGGCELAMHADIIIAGKGAMFGQPEIKVGIMPGAGGTQRLVRVIGKFHAMRLLLTGLSISGDEAYAMGLASEVVEDDQVLDRSLELANLITQMPPIAVAQIKEVVQAGMDASLEAALMLERKAFQLLFASSDQREGMNAFFEKRQPNFRGA
ncbi:MAG: enoyl-CoA hydratase [Sulfuritalea sp.]|nr:enoyl-CoA hydratase [Sulfuritalea sp.]